MNPRQRAAMERLRKERNDARERDREAFHATAGGRALYASPVDLNSRLRTPGVPASAVYNPQIVGSQFPRIHKVRAFATAGQSLSASGGPWQFDAVDGSPVGQIGFSTSSPTTSSWTSDLTGRAEFVAWWRWGLLEPSSDGRFRTAGEFVVSRNRGGSVETDSVARSAVAAQHGAVAVVMDCEVGDEFSFYTPHSAGGGRDLGDGEVEIRVIETGPAVVADVTDEGFIIYPPVVPEPETLSAGQLGVITNWGRDNFGTDAADNVAALTGSGWTQLVTMGSYGTSVGRMTVLYKIAAGGEDPAAMLADGGETSWDMAVWEPGWTVDASSLRTTDSVTVGDHVYPVSIPPETFPLFGRLSYGEAGQTDGVDFSMFSTNTDEASAGEYSSPTLTPYPLTHSGFNVFSVDSGKVVRRATSALSGHPDGIVGWTLQFEYDPGGGGPIEQFESFCVYLRKTS